MYASIVVSGIPVCIGALRFKTLSARQRVLFFLVVLSCLTELLSLLLARLRINNLFVLHFFTAAEFTLISLIYCLGLESRKAKLLVLSVLALFLCFVLYDSLFIDSLDSMDSAASAAESLLLIIYSLVFFFIILRRTEYSNLFDDPMFWFNAAVLIYFSGNLFLFIFSNYILAGSDNYFNAMWVVHDVLNLGLNILFSLALWKR